MYTLLQILSSDNVFRVKWKCIPKMFTNTKKIHNRRKNIVYKGTSYFEQWTLEWIENNKRVCRGGDLVNKHGLPECSDKVKRLFTGRELLCGRLSECHYKYCRLALSWIVKYQYVCFLSSLARILFWTNNSWIN